jgi:hypothetical protein
MSHRFGRPAACCTIARRRFDSTSPTELRRELSTRPQVLPRVGNASGRRCFERRRYCQSRSLAVAAAESVGTTASSVAPATCGPACRAPFLCPFVLRLPSMGWEAGQLPLDSSPRLGYRHLASGHLTPKTVQAAQGLSTGKTRPRCRTTLASCYTVTLSASKRRPILRKADYTLSAARRQRSMLSEG